MAKVKYVQVESTIAGTINDAFTQVEDLKSGLQDWYDNLPENFQNGSKGEALTEAINQLELDSEPEVPEYIREAPIQVTHTKARKMSRRLLCEEATGMLESVVSWLESEIEAYRDGAAENSESDHNERADELETLKDELSSAVDNWQSTEFPGMFG